MACIVRPDRHAAGERPSVLVCRLASYASLPSPRPDETWRRFHFTAVAVTPDGAGAEQPATTYRVDVSSNRALRARTERLASADLEKLLYWCGVQGLTRSLGVDPSVTEIRTRLRWRSLLEPEVGRLRFPRPEPFEVPVRRTVGS